MAIGTKQSEITPIIIRSMMIYMMNLQDLRIFGITARAASLSQSHFIYFLYCTIGMTCLLLAQCNILASWGAMFLSMRWRSLKSFIANGTHNFNTPILCFVITSSAAIFSCIFAQNRYVKLFVASFTNLFNAFILLGSQTKATPRTIFCRLSSISLNLKLISAIGATNQSLAKRRHFLLSFAGSANWSGGQAAKQAVRTVHEAMLVHQFIVLQIGGYCYPS